MYTTVKIQILTSAKNLMCRDDKIGPSGWKESCLNTSSSLVCVIFFWFSTLKIILVKINAQVKNLL